MRSTRNTVGGVFAAITAGISLVMAIWDVVSWIMTMSLGNIFAITHKRAAASQPLFCF